MAITPLRDDKAPPPLAAYDLEWHRGTYKLRICGVRDERGFRSYRTIPEFLFGELTHANRGRVFFAHFGGRFDIQLLRHVFASCGYLATFIVSGSGAPIVRVTKGRDSWTFADLGALFRYSLAKLGKAVGLEKLDCDTETAPYPLLRQYNARDCEIVWVALQKLVAALGRLGAPFRLTSGSLALGLLRARYLTEPVATSRIDNKTIAPSYYASRIEPWAQYVESVVGRVWREYDINSSFPHSMACAPLPGALRYVEAPRGAFATRAGYYQISHVRIRTLIDTPVPSVPTRAGGRVFFPVGTVEGYYTEDDILEAIADGGEAEYIGDSHYYELTGVWRDCVLALWDLRREAIRDGDLFLAEAIKIVINSIYGKLAEREDKLRVVLLPEGGSACPHEGAHDGPQGASCMTPLGGGYWGVSETVEVPHAHVAAGAATTARSRNTIKRRFADSLARVPRSLAYGDTDALITCAEFPIGDGLGELKASLDRIERGVFVAPKLIGLWGVVKKGADPVDTFRGKGFSRLDAERFAELMRGNSIDITRMRGLREGDWGEPPCDVTVSKGHGRRVKKPENAGGGASLQALIYCEVCGTVGGEGLRKCSACGVGVCLPLASARPKRCMTSDGFSRAWDARELLEPWGN